MSASPSSGSPRGAPDSSRCPIDGGARRAELVEQYRHHHLNPYLAAERGYVDDVIDPADTRTILAGALDMLSTRVEDRPPRKHANVPL